MRTAGKTVILTIGMIAFVSFTPMEVAHRTRCGSGSGQGVIASSSFTGDVHAAVLSTVEDGVRGLLPDAL